MMTVNKLKIIRFMKELVKRLSVPIAEMGACMVMVCLLPSCSVASLFHEEIGKEEAMVLMADSTRYVGKTFLPDFQGKSFRLVTDEGKRVKIKSGEVEQLRFRRDGKQSGVFVYVPYVARGGKESKPGWVNCQGVGGHLKIGLLAFDWRFNRKGELAPMSFADGDVYIIGIKEDGKGQFLSTLGRTKAVVRKALCKFLADDPVLCGQIEDKEVDAFDFQEICNRYTPGREQGHGSYEVMAVPLQDGMDETEKGGNV